jgi:hypothetical protein
MNPTATAAHMEAISSHESRSLGGLHANHLRGAHRGRMKVGCKLCREAFRGFQSEAMRELDEMEKRVHTK